MHLTFCKRTVDPLGSDVAKMSRGMRVGWLFPVRYEGSICPFVEKKVIDRFCSIWCNDASEGLRAKKQLLSIEIDRLGLSFATVVG
jgi:hypothetical protein